MRAGGAERDRAGAEQHAAEEGATVAGRRRVPRPRAECRRGRARRRGGGAPRPAPGPARPPAATRPAARASSPGGPRSGRWRGRACADEPREEPCSRPISSARRSQARAGWMRASSPLTSPARSTATVRRRWPPGGRCGAERGRAIRSSCWRRMSAAASLAGSWRWALAGSMTSSSTMTTGSSSSRRTSTSTGSARQPSGRRASVLRLRMT